MPKLAVAYDAPPTLGRFLGSNAFVRVVVGPVGSGKSSACVMELFRRALEQKRGPDGIRRSRWAVVRNTYGQLRDTTRKTFEQWVPHHLGQWKEQEFTFRMRWGDVEADYLFRALDRPEDVRKLLSLELTGAYINEVREVPRHVLDVLQTRVGRYPAKNQGGPSWWGVWADTNPWHSGHWAHELFAQRPDGYALFRQPGGRAPDAENVENLPPGYYERLVAGKDTEWVKVYVDGQDASTDVGAILAPWLDRVDAAGRICDFEHPTAGVFAHFDIGVGDAAAVWAWRVNEETRGVDVLNYHEESGQSVGYFADVLAGWGYRHERVFLPHDARARNFATGTTTHEQLALRMPGLVSVMPQAAVHDGISAARWLLEQPHTRIHTRCTEGLKALRGYRFEWDEVDRHFSRRPLHNWASHGSDAFRYLSLTAREAELRTRPPEPPKQGPAGRALDSFCLDELWDTAPTARRR